MMDTSKLTLEEKGALVVKLTEEIVAEMTTDEFIGRSDGNRHRGSLMRVFGKESFVSNAGIVHKYTKGAD